MAKLRFQLRGIFWGYRIDGKRSSTGFLTVEVDGSVCVKTLFNTEYLFSLDTVQGYSRRRKLLTVTTTNGTTIEIKGKPGDLDGLVQLINTASAPKERGLAG